jgi:hypothetical protein
MARSKKPTNKKRMQVKNKTNIIWKCTDSTLIKDREKKGKFKKMGIKNTGTNPPVLIESPVEYQERSPQVLRFQTPCGFPSEL